MTTKRSFKFKNMQYYKSIRETLECKFEMIGSRHRFKLELLKSGLRSTFYRDQTSKTKNIAYPEVQNQLEQ